MEEFLRLAASSVAVIGGGIGIVAKLLEFWHTGRLRRLVDDLRSDLQVSNGMNRSQLKLQYLIASSELLTRSQDGRLSRFSSLCFYSILPISTAFTIGFSIFSYNSEDGLGWLEYLISVAIVISTVASFEEEVRKRFRNLSRFQVSLLDRKNDVNNHVGNREWENGILGHAKWSGLMVMLGLALAAFSSGAIFYFINMYDALKEFPGWFPALVMGFTIGGIIALYGWNRYVIARRSFRRHVFDLAQSRLIAPWTKLRHS